jgi:uncharacterized membrane protein (UPF0182 family)
MERSYFCSDMATRNQQIIRPFAISVITGLFNRKNNRLFHFRNKEIHSIENQHFILDVGFFLFLQTDQQNLKI